MFLFELTVFTDIDWIRVILLSKLSIMCDYLLLLKQYP
jgi:hypothetical protein